MNTITATVQFCGAGGTSEAARQAGIRVEAAINHSKIAIATHEANHKNCQHFQQDITEIDPADVPDSDMLLTSPCCTNHSSAKGKKQYHQFDLHGDIIFDPLAEKSRNTMEDVVRFAAAKKQAGNPYKMIVVENVIDVVKWRKYSTWLQSLSALGYAHQNLYWNSQFFGVPQSRDRVYIVFWFNDISAPDLEHRPIAFCEHCESSIQAVQCWKRALKWGSYREQYTYNCPRCTREVAPHFTPASSALSLENRGETLGNRKRPLVTKTLENIREGIERFHGQPFLLGYYNNPVFRQLSEPIGTITTMDRWAYVVPATRFENTTLRMITPEEVKRCMGFPESYQVLGTAKQQVEQLGNAVVPAVMANILKRCTAVLAPEMEQVA